MAAKDVRYYSALQRERLSYVPPLPNTFRNNPHLKVQIGEQQIKLASDDANVVEQVKAQFKNVFSDRIMQLVPSQEPEPNTPMNIAVVLSGGQAPGGHNVIAGVFDFLKKNNKESKLFGFLGGPKGVFTHKYIEITDDNLRPYRNQGGFDIIGSGRDKIEKPEHFASSAEICKKLQLDGLIIIGGDDSNTNAAVLAEYFAENRISTRVIGVPKTIDGDLKGPFIETSFGFDTACKTYAELIGNIAADANASRKYYHFIRLMGRAASHITLECALLTHPNFAFVGEWAENQKKTLQDLVNEFATAVESRHKLGKNFGIVLIAEGLIDFIPEVHHLISELNDLMAKDASLAGDEQRIAELLSAGSRRVFEYLPSTVRGQLLLDRDAHGNVQLSKIETEKLVISLTETELKRRGFTGPFRTITHFLGYEGRCSLPSIFDCDYCYSLGYTAGYLVRLGVTGAMAFARKLTHDVSEWEVGGVPIASMIHMERRKGKDVPVIRKALVDLDGAPFKEYLANRKTWRLTESYSNPGPIQFHGPAAKKTPRVLVLEAQAAATTA